MSYPPVRQLGPGVQLEIEQRRSEARQARRIALSARRRQELELQRQPAPARHSRSIRDDRRAHLGRSHGAAVAAVVLAVSIAVVVAANAGDVLKTTSPSRSGARVIVGPTEPQRRCTHR